MGLDPGKTHSPNLSGVGYQKGAPEGGAERAVAEEAASHSL